MSVDKKVLGWLTNCPASDINFKGQLKDANSETMREALKSRTISQTARKAIKAQIIRRARENESHS